MYVILLLCVLVQNSAIIFVSYFGLATKFVLWDDQVHLPIRTMVHAILDLLLYLNMHATTGGLAAGAIGGIVIAAVVFAVLYLIVIAVIVYYMRLRSKNQKSTLIVRENYYTSVGDLQTQSYAQPFDAIKPKDSTHLDYQSNTVSQESDRRQFLKRGVRRIFARDCTFVFFNTVLLKQDNPNLVTSSNIFF